MKKSFAIWIVFVAIILVYGCGRKDSPLSPFRWDATGGEFDSLTIAFDYATWRGVMPDSLSGIADKAFILARQDSSNILKQSRTHFFKGVISFKSNKSDEAEREFQKARNMIDSAEHPYDVSRIDFWLVDAKKEKRGLEAYNRTMEKIRFYDEIGDSALLAMQYGDLGLLLKKYGDFNEACKALKKATSLFNHSGLTKQAQGNIINTASCLERMGRTREAVSLLRNLVEDPLIISNPAAYPIAFYNLYIWDKDTAALRRAKDLIMKSDLPMNLRQRGSVLAHWSHEYLSRGEVDSAYKYSLLAVDNLGPSYSGDSAFILRNHSEVMERRGNTGEALKALKQCEDISVRIADERDAEQIHVLTTSRLVADVRMQTELQHEHKKLFWMVLSLSLLLLLFIGAWWFRRERHEQQLRQMKSHLEKETLQHKIMSMQIATKDNDSFLYTFASINPNFTQRLKDAYPDLSPMDLKLAAFAALKLDIKQVARILGIKPESVKQSRWRLRRKLGLTPYQNLEDALLPYLDQEPE